MNDTWADENRKFSNLYIYKQICEIENKSNKKWKVIGIGSIAILLLSLIVMFYAINLPKTVPMVITVSDWGEAKYVGEVTKLSYNGLKIPQIAIEYQLRKFITNKYTISTDPSVVRNNLKDCYSALTSTSAQKLSEELKKNNPLKEVGSVIRNVEIESILTVSKSTYQVDFIVKTTGLTGKLNRQQRIRGVITTTTMEPMDEDKVLNPLGIYFTNFDFTEIK